MVKILVIYYSKTWHIVELAKSVVDGIKDTGVAVLKKSELN